MHQVYFKYLPHLVSKFGEIKSNLFSNVTFTIKYIPSFNMSFFLKYINFAKTGKNECNMKMLKKGLFSEALCNIVTLPVTKTYHITYRWKAGGLSSLKIGK